MRGGVDGELLADAIAILHRTHGVGAATGALALAEAIGASEVAAILGAEPSGGAPARGRRRRRRWRLSRRDRAVVRPSGGRDRTRPTFEFEQGALDVLRGNLHANPARASRIAINEHALWDEPGHELPILVSGPGTTVMAGTPEPDDEGNRPVEQLVPTTSIDALVGSGELERVDFLKLDIEGAEPAALRGAEQTLRRFTPRLALAAYHRFDDMWALMRQIDQIDLGYQFAMAHFTPHHEETVLYAWVPEDR
jgi:FkbM family methyltransferase